MQLHDITESTATNIILRKEPRVFFAWNISKELEFTLSGVGAEAHIFTLFIGGQGDRFSLNVKQIHRAPKTRSHLHALALLGGNSHINYRGEIRIDPSAENADASQKNRNILLSKDAHALSEPVIEILSDSGTARHGSTTAGTEDEALIFLELRGIDQTTGTRVLAEGAVRNFFDDMRKLANDPRTEEHEKAALTHLEHLYD